MSIQNLQTSLQIKLVYFWSNISAPNCNPFSSSSSHAPLGRARAELRAWRGIERNQLMSLHWKWKRSFTTDVSSSGEGTVWPGEENGQFKSNS